MKKYLTGLFSVVFVLSGCVPVSTLVPDGTATAIVSPLIVPAATTANAITPTITSQPATPTLTAASLPDGLVVAYVLKDAIWLWKQNRAQLLIEREGVFAPLLSDDRQWLIFKQRHLDEVLSEEVWVMRTDGSELHRLLGPEELLSLTEEGTILLANDIRWLPGRHELLFNTLGRIDGPPEWVPVFDLHLLDLSGQVTHLADPGQGGEFVLSPDGSQVAVAAPSRIGMIDLKSGEQRTLLEFEPVGFGSDYLGTPDVVWDPQSQFIMTSILPPKLYSLEEYAGEPAQVWRLFVNGKVELVADLQPFAPAAGIVFAPNLQYFFYLNDSCSDGMGMLYVHTLTSGDETPLFCVWELPQWLPDDEHFIHQTDWLWQLGSIVDHTNQPLDVLNLPTDPSVRASPPLTWIDDEYFLLTLYSDDACMLHVATLQGVVTEIARTPRDSCPEADFSLSK